MAVHTSLFSSETVAVGTVYDGVDAVVDQVLGYRNGAHVPSVPMALVALAATGASASGDDTSSLASARVQSPKTVISPVYVRPINVAASFPPDPAVSCFAANPVLMRPGEEVSASATVVTTATPPPLRPATIVAWFVDRLEPVPAAESYWVPFTAPVPTIGAATWQTFPITFQDTTTLPAGRYAILGLHLVCPSGADAILCGRLVIPGENLRPGIVTSPSASALTPPLASDNSLGVWGHFDAQLPPSLEVFAPPSAAAMSGDLSGFLRVAQVAR